MLILDTDHISDFMRENTVGLRLAARLQQRSRVLHVSIVSIEELLRGRLAQLAKQKELPKALPIYEELRRLLTQQDYWTILSWTPAAVQQFDHLSKLKLRVGTMDLKIASIALAHNATLLSRNLRDFKRIPDLNVEDWTI